MKKQNNIFTYIAKITYSVTLITSLYACTDEDIIKKSTLEEGIPVKINMKYVSPKMDNISTRGLNDQQELQVNNLYILIFNETGNDRIIGGGLYENTTNLEKITLNTTSGKRLIYGIANAKTNQQDQEELIKKLEMVNNLTDLNNLVISTELEKGFIEVDRTSPDLLMSGAYMDPAYTNTNKPSGYCEIQPGTTTLSGKLQLIHLDSHIKFNIHTGNKVNKIEPKKWRVCNVPTQSYIIERTDTTNCSASAYANSIEYNNQTIHAEKDSRNHAKDMHTFSFYQFENFNYAKPSLTSPKDREKEIKNSNGSNSGKFEHINGHPTYVEFSAYIELTTRDENLKEITRVADIKLMILLGGINATKDYDFKNFNTWRNQKYTYDVTINDVNDIVTEVTKKDETRPGIEGDVIDAQDQVRILDAHYNCFNIILTAAQVDEMSILVYTPFDKVEYNSKTANTAPSGNNRDYKWIKFKYLGERESLDKAVEKTDCMPLATFNESDVLDIYSLRNDVMERGRDGREHYYTVFIEEYFYNEIPNGKLWTKPYWKHFVNQDDRYVMLIYTPEKSDDKESSYSKSRYFIKQKSIQTYYSTTNLTDDETALGMEHVNESPKPLRVVGSSLDNGYKNCKDFIGNKVWEDFVFTDYIVWKLGFTYCEPKFKQEFKNTFELKIKHLNSLCLSRNRDENGNGKIDGEELKWYVPTYKQISGMYLGATSLPSPLFTPPSNGSTVIFDDINYHFMTSEGDKIWAQEGCSNKGTEANQMRCVRNLGLNATESYNKPPTQPYVKSGDANSHYVFDMSRITESNLRAKKSTTLGAHENFKDTKNKPYKKFELANKFSKTKFKGKQRTWEKFLIFTKGVDECQDYYEGSEDDPTRGKGQWRIPNQRELLIIYNLLGIGEMRYIDLDDPQKTVYGMYSCTYWDYDHWTDYEGTLPPISGYRVFGAHATVDKMFLDNVKENNLHLSEHSTILRCVRDID